MVERLTKNFTKVPNEVVQERKVSIKAIGMLTILCWCPPGWNYSVCGFATMFGVSKGTISKLLNELEAAGYLERKRTRGSDGRLSYSEYHVLINPAQEKQPLNNQELILREERKDAVISESTANHSLLNKINFLTADVRTLERHLNRSLTPSEKEIWESWQRENVEPHILKLAIQDNEFRNGHLRLHHVDGTLKKWKANGLTSIKDIENAMLDSKYQNTLSKLKANMGGKADEAFISEKADTSDVGDTRLWRNQLIEQYRDGDPKFDGTALGCPLKVFIYLPDEILQAMIIIFRKYNYQDKVSAAKDALSEALERRL